MTTLLLYQDIQPLNRDAHRTLRLKQADDCAFAARTHLVPLAGSESFQVARHYPILFIGEGDKAMPIALLGLKPGHNCFVDDANRWAPNTYVPAFIRRYPFVLAQDQAQNFTVCLDQSFTGWNQDEGQVLFKEDGSNSEYLEEMIRFLQNFTAEMDRTRAFVEALNALGLLGARTLKLTHSNGETFVLNDFMAVDEEKFLALDDAQVLALHRNGHLGWIYAHLMSLGNANQLFDRHLATMQTASAEPTEGANPGNAPVPSEAGGRVEPTDGRKKAKARHKN